MKPFGRTQRKGDGGPSGARSKRGDRRRRRRCRTFGGRFPGVRVDAGGLGRGEWFVEDEVVDVEELVGCVDAHGGEEGRQREVVLERPQESSAHGEAERGQVRRERRVGELDEWVLVQHDGLEGRVPRVVLGGRGLSHDAARRLCVVLGPGLVALLAVQRVEHLGEPDHAEVVDEAVLRPRLHRLVHGGRGRAPAEATPQTRWAKMGPEWASGRNSLPAIQRERAGVSATST